jgi:hypothetical protein
MDVCSTLRVADSSIDAQLEIRHGYMHETVLPVRNMVIDAVVDCG